MKRLLPFTVQRSIALFCLAATLGVSACLPGEGDVSQKYNNINQRAQIENTALSLMQASNEMTAYLVASSMRLKSPLDKIGITQLPSIPDTKRPKPVPPKGVGVVTCGTDKLGALAYFTVEPKGGVPPLKTSGATMAKALSDRFGSSAVGLKTIKGETQYPKIATNPKSDCQVDLPGIVPNSPIFASGFEYKGYDDLGVVLPDPNEATQPTVTRNVAINCPSGLSGVVQREQTCKLISSNDPNDKEKIKIGIGGDKYENNAVRLDKTWKCTPEQNATLTPTPEEITEYCIDPAKGLVKPADNTITMDTASWKKVMEGQNGGTYSFVCRQNSDGSNSCDAKPYTPPPNWNLVCDQEVQEPRYVINPAFQDPLKREKPVINWDTGNIAESGQERDCGRGWVGDIKYEYQLRQCNLYSPQGQAAPAGHPKTIYWMGQVAVKCKRDPKPGENWVAECPVGVGSLLIKKRFVMNKWVATAPDSYERGVISKGHLFGGVADAQTEARMKKPEFKDTTRLCGGPNVTNWWDCVMTLVKYFSMNTDKSYADGVEASIGSPDVTTIPVGCNTNGQSCKTLGEVKNLVLLVDRSGSMDDGDANVSYTYPACIAQIASYFPIPNRGEACGLIDSFVAEVLDIPREPCTDPDPRACDYNYPGETVYTDETNDKARAGAAVLAGLAKPNMNQDWRALLLSGQKCGTPISGGKCLRGVPSGPQNSCIGDCVTLSKEEGGKSRINAVNEYITGVIVPSLKGGTKISYGEINSRNFNNFTYQMCEADIVRTFTIRDPSTGAVLWTYTSTQKCSQEDDKANILRLIGSAGASGNTPLYGALEATINEAMGNGANGEGTYVMILTDGQPTDSPRNNVTGVCSGSKPIYKYIRERMPGAFTNLILLGDDSDVRGLRDQCLKKPTDEGWEFTDGKNVNDLSKAMNKKFPTVMPAPGGQMCAEYLKTHNPSGYTYAE